MAYATKAQIQTMLGRTFTIPAHYTNDSDAVLNVAIQRAAAKIDIFTGSHWESLIRDVQLQGDGTDVLDVMRVTSWPIRSISSIFYKDSLSVATFDTEIDATTYMLSSSLRHVLRTGYDSAVSRRYGLGSSVWVKSPGNNYLMTCVFGSLATPILITEATVLLVRNEIEPGHIDSWMPLYSESFQDGYSYVRSVSAGGGGGGIASKTGRNPITTGHAFVDVLLAPHVKILPMIAVGI